MLSPVPTQYLVRLMVVQTNLGQTLELTGGQLYPGADLVHAPRVAEEKEAQADDATHDQQHRDPHEEHGRLEGAGRDGAEVQRAAFADELRRERVPYAVVEEAEVSGLRRVDAVPDPVWLDEHHHGDDCEGDGENRPQHAHGARVTHVVGVVDFSRLLSREHDGRSSSQLSPSGGKVAKKVRRKRLQDFLSSVKLMESELALNGCALISTVSAGVVFPL